MSTRLVGGDPHITALRAQDASAAKVWVHVIGRWRRSTIIVEAIGAGPGRADLQLALRHPPDVAPPDDGRLRLEAIATTLAVRALDWGLEAWATDAVDETGLPYAYAELFRVSPELAEWADQQPDGLVRLDPSVRRNTD